MTCSRNFRRVVQAGCLGLIGALTVVGCGGSESSGPKPDASSEVGPGGGKPNLNANPASVPLGPVDIGKTSTPASVTITNTGTAAGTVTVVPSGVGISAAGCTGSLAVNGSCTISITATPTAVGPIVGSVAVSALGGNTVNISVSGNAVQPGAFTVSPTAIPLGDLAVGSSVPVSITVTATAAITGLTTGVLGTNLTLDTGLSTCKTTLDANASCVVAATFVAATVGPATADAISVSQGGVMKSVPVTANVLSPAKLAATPPKLDLAAKPGETAEQEVQIGNVGGLITGTLTVAATGASFKVKSETCTIVTLGAGKFCSVIVSYSPAATATVAETGTLTVTDKGPGASVATVALTGTPNISGLEIKGGPALGSVAPGATGVEVIFTVTNTAAAPTGPLTATVNSALVAKSSDTCATKATLNKGDTCTVGLKLAPPAGTTAQAVSGLLTVGNTAVSAAASFTGNVITSATLSATPPSVTFGSIPVNQKSAVQTVTVQNMGATATGTLSVILSGTGAAQVVSSGTCTGTLAPAATCTVSVQYSPTDTTGVSGTITISDGTASVAVPMSGTGLTPSIFETNISSVPFGSAAVGYTIGGKLLYVGIISTATTATGAITYTIDGAAKDDFAVVSTTCTNLQPGMTLDSGACSYTLKFTPSAVGTREATLTLTGAAGGVRTIPLTGTGLALVEIKRLGCAHINGTAVDFDETVATSGLDFGKRTLGKTGDVCKYTAIVRGATAPAAVTTTATVDLATSTPADFRNVTVSGFKSAEQSITATDVNPCTGAALSLVKDLGVPATGTVGNWTDSTSEAAGAHLTGQWECPFFIQFTPQTSKGAKTAALTLSGSAGGSDPKTLTGEAVGPLQFDADKTFTAAVGTTSATQNLVLTNNGVAAEGKLTIALGGTNAGDFGIVVDGCSGTSPAAGASCTVTLAFAPTSTGTKTATVTVTSASSSETATATLTGTASATYTLTLTPTSSATSPVSFGSVAQANASEYKTFTITNPAGGGLTGKLTYGIGSCTANADAAANFTLYTLASSSTGYPAGSCGDRNTTQLAGGSACTIQARFNPANDVAPSASVPRTAQLWVCVGGTHTLTASLSGIATPQLTVSGAALTTVAGVTTADFGTVAKAGTKSLSFTLTNNGLSAATLTIPATLADSAGTDGSFTIAADSACGATLAAGVSCIVKYTVTAAAAATGPVTATATITAGAAVSTSVALTATPVAPADIVLYGITGNADRIATVADPTGYVEFGKLPINSTATNGSGVVVLWFKNQGGVPGTGLALNLTNRDATDTGAFSLVPENKGTCDALTGGELAPNAICSVRLRFKPTTIGNKTAQLTLTATDSAPVYLRGEAVANPAPGLSVTVAGGTDTVYSFPATAIAASTSVYLQLQNAGSAAYTQVFAAVGGQATDFAVTGEASGAATACDYVVATKTVTVPAAGGCQVKVTFTPATPWDETTRYRWSAIETSTARVFGLIGQAKQPAKLELSATGSGTTKVDAALLTVDFGQVLADTSASVVFTIKNVGETATTGAPALTLSAAALAFTQQASSTCTAALDVNGTCTVTVATLNTLGLGAQGGATATATATEASAASSSAYKLSAAVVAASSLKVSPSADQAVGSVAVGATSSATTVTITNGNSGETSANRQDLSGLAVTLSNATDFVVSYGTAAGTCGALMAATTDGTFKLTGGASCTITISFAPTTVGALESTVTVASGTKTASVKFTGTGIGSLAITPASTAAAPVSANTPVTLTVTNSSASATGRLRTTLAGANYVVTTDNCYGQSVAAGGNCTMVVTFIGTLSATAQTATVTVTDGSPTASATAYLSAKS